MKIRKSYIGIAALCLAGAVIVPIATSASAATPSQTVTAIPLNRPDARQVVAANGHVFISAGNVVLVYDGTSLVKTITGQPGAEGLLASSDGATLYVADRAASRIGVIDTTTLVETTSYTTQGCPAYLAATTSRLFYSYGCTSSQWNSGIASVSIANGTDDHVITTPSGPFSYAPAHLSAAGDHLAVVEDSLEPATMTTYIASGNSVVQQATYSGGNVHSIAVSPDGTEVAYANMSSYRISVRTFSDLAPSNEMVTGPYPNLAIWSHSGAQVAAGISGFSSDATVDLFSMPDGILQTSAAVTGLSGWVNTSALAFSSDDTTVYGLSTGTTSTENGYLYIASTTPDPTASPTASPSSTPTASPSQTPTPTPSVSPTTPGVVPVDFPPLVDLKTKTAHDMAYAHGHIFVSSGNTVLVYDGSTLVTTIYGQPGAWGLLTSPDGSSVYVADSGASRIAVIDATSLTQKTTFTTTACPRNLATTTTRLYYTSGCTLYGWDSGVGSVKLSDGTDNRDITFANGNSFAYSPAQIAAAGNHVVIGSQGLSPGQLATYVDSAGQLTLQASTDTLSGAVAISPDGQLIAAGAITVVNFSDLGPNNQMLANSPDGDVQFSHSGNRIAVGLQAWYIPASLQIYDLPNGILQAQSSTPEPGRADLQLWIDAIRFTPDDSGIYVLAFNSYDNEAYIALASTTPGAHPSPTPTPSQTSSPSPTVTASPSPSPTVSPSPSPTYTPSPTPTNSPTPTVSPSATPVTQGRQLSLRAVGVSAPGKPLKLTATVPGEAGVQVRFRTSDSTAYVHTVVATTNSQGVAQATIAVNYSGTATATVAATDLLSAASVSVFFEVPSRVTLSFAHPVATVGGVSVYRAAGAVRLVAHSRPIGTNHLELRLYRKIGGQWVLRLDQSLKTNALGDAVVHLPALVKKHVYREVIFAGPTANNATSPRQTFTFEIR